ncbi:GNAT family protein [Lentilactobacillus sp. Marseille-Q4993]|uniref:GNAT family N-acetyltransferase n=1 Tax=Lentilactobacillus sp. Marseille-Q4993 TaxID=3039492 RepID=UPI0024BD0331|nr:GNAT family protein [Lentilactobacillus sp. Marseille-Q4993]
MFYHKVTDNISLKIPTNSDAEELVRLIADDRKNLAQYLPWAETTMTASDEQEFIKFSYEQMAAGNLLLTVITVNGHPAGMIDIHQINQTNHAGQIGYWLGREYRGAGVMTSCLREMEKIAFNELALHRLELIADIKNKPSRDVAIRLDYHEDGILKDYLFHTNEYHDVVLYSKINPN